MSLNGTTIEQHYLPTLVQGLESEERVPHCGRAITDMSHQSFADHLQKWGQAGFDKFSRTSSNDDTSDTDKRWVFINTSISSLSPKFTSYSLRPPGWGGRNDSLQFRELSHVCKSSYSSPTVVYLVKAEIRKIWWCHNAHLHIVGSRPGMCMAFKLANQVVTRFLRYAIGAGGICNIWHFAWGHHLGPSMHWSMHLSVGGGPS